MKSIKLFCLISSFTLLFVGCKPSTDTSNNTTPADSAATADSTAAAEDSLSDAGENEAAILESAGIKAGWSATWTGVLESGEDVSVNLFVRGDIAKGSVNYTKSQNKQRILLGTIENESSFFLKEMGTDANVWNTWSGDLKGKNLEGTLTDYVKQKTTKFSLVESAEHPKGTAEWPFEAKKDVSGTYDFHFGKDGASGSLKVKVAGDVAKISFDCNGGKPAYNMATLEDREAAFKDNTANYTDPDYGCVLKIEFFDGFAIARYTTDKLDCGFGGSATVEGSYLKMK